MADYFRVVERHEERLAVFLAGDQNCCEAETKHADRRGDDQTDHEASVVVVVVVSVGGTLRWRGRRGRRGRVVELGGEVGNLLVEDGLVVARLICDGRRAIAGGYER